MLIITLYENTWKTPGKYKIHPKKPCPVVKHKINHSSLLRTMALALSSVKSKRPYPVQANVSTKEENKP